MDGRLRGRVETFDDPRGVGTVAPGRDGGTLPFHCTAIADGSRTIAAGTEVTYVQVPGRLGLWEAADIRPA
jgi:cold shock CspA family protein